MELTQNTVATRSDADAVLTHGIELSDCSICETTLAGGERCPNAQRPDHATGRSARSRFDLAVSSVLDTVGCVEELVDLPLLERSLLRGSLVA